MIFLIRKTGIVAVMATIMFFSSLYEAYASNCPSDLDDTNTIEKEFTRSDVVFSGIYQGAEEGTGNFDVLEIFKAPDEKYLSNKTIKIHFGGGTSNENSGKEFIVFAHYDYHGLLIPNECGLTHQAAQSKIDDIKRQEKGPASERESENIKFIFTGKVVSLEQSEGKKDPYNFAWRESPSFVAEFSSLEILRNKSEKPHLDKIDSIQFHGRGCYKKLELGRNYLIYAMQARIKGGEMGYHFFCHVPYFLDIHEKDMLRELNKGVKPAKELK